MHSSALRRILVIGTLDTKGEEIGYLKEQLLAAGSFPEIVDIGVMGEPLFAADVRREEIAACAGESAEELRQAGDRGRAVAAMQRGLVAWIGKRHAQSPLAGVLAGRDIRPVSYAEWLRIETAETDLAKALGRGERVKLHNREAIWSACRPPRD